jgi:hypothetical protein
MPEVLKNWLESLSPTDADAVYVYIDGDPEADAEILEILSDKVNT